MCFFQEGGEGGRKGGRGEERKESSLKTYPVGGGSAGLPRGIHVG